MLIATLEPHELNKDDHLIIDVREKEEHEEEHIPHSLLSPLSTFDPEKLPPPPGKTYVFHCRSGKRSLHAAELWTAYWGQHCYNLKGGIIAWKNTHET